MAFASVEDVQTRLVRDLTDTEKDSVGLVIELVEGLIADAAGKDSDWAEGLDPVPATLRVLCIEKAVCIASNPTSLASASEQLGAYQHAETYRKVAAEGYAEIFLSDDEERLARRAIYGTTRASAASKSTLEEAFGENADSVVINSPELDPEPEDWDSGWGW